MSRQPAAASEALAYTVADVQRVARLGRTKIYELLATGQLRAMKAGARTLIDAESLRRYLASLPTLQPKKAA
ncbi:MAG: helix-turn-helix domain-containing protein [Acetobacteraceae bacterium]|nr:helix-turn-helix domain-containing protein [Acetobacteraceae bacterium]